MVTPNKCNEAEASSLALRLAGLLSKASASGLLLSLLASLHVGYLVDMIITFQIIREVRLSLTHLINTDTSHLLRMPT